MCVEEEDQEIKTKFEILKAPQYLVVEVEIFNEEGTLKVLPFQVAETIDLSSFYSKRVVGGYGTYELQSMAVAVGDLPTGYYETFAARKQGEDKTWYKFTKDTYEEVEQEDVMDEGHHAQLLFYKLV